MNSSKVPIDGRGNEICVDNECVVSLGFPMLFKVVAVENGGIHTANGITPATIRLVCDITLRQLPGLPFQSLIRTVAPTEQKILEDLSGGFLKG